MNAFLRRAAVLAAAVFPLTACSDSGIDPDEVTGIPESWRSDTAEDWPDSDAYGGSMAILSRGTCLLADDPPELFGASPKFTEVGYGGFGTSKDGYQYACNFWAEDEYAGSLTLTQATTATEADKLVTEFDGQQSSKVQDNSVETVTSGQLQLSVLSRWYPTNPQGAYQALYYDADELAVVVLEVNSLDKQMYDDASPQEVADALVALMAQAS